MKTMPRPVLRVLRSTVESMLTIIRWWEDRQPDHGDYRMTELVTGLWQASQSMRAILEGDFQPMRRQSPLWNEPEKVVLGDAYVQELLVSSPIPLRVAE